MKLRMASVFAAAVLATAAISGCNGNGKTDTPAEQSTVNAANRTGNAANNASSNTNNAIKDAAKDTTAALVVTPKVSGALKEDKTVSAPGNVINVDSKDNVVHLKGTVQTNDIKKRAGEIAKKVLTDNHSTDQLSNELKVMHH